MTQCLIGRSIELFFICYETGRSFEKSFGETILKKRKKMENHSTYSYCNGKYSTVKPEICYLPKRATFPQQLRFQASPKRQSTHSKILSLSSPYTGTSLQWLVILFCHNCNPLTQILLFFSLLLPKWPVNSVT